MKDLVKIFSTQEILLFLVIFASAVKGFVSFWDWGYGRLKQMFKKENDKEQEIDSIQVQFNEYIKNYEIMQNTQNETLRILTDKINLLIDSDKDSIKSFITERHHHFCYNKKWIDDYSLDCIEKRYKHYTDENGNSFIYDLMKELRALPKQPRRDNEN